jgi:hypothetical protein
MAKPVRLLASVAAAMLALRLGWVLAFREIDSDAYGHFSIAMAAWRDPTNLAVHWVWLPLFHYVVGALAAVGVTFRGLRFVDATLATAGPFLLYATLRARRVPEDAALLGALVFAVAPLPTILGQSAQPETLFSVAILVTAWAAAKDRPALAGLALTVACFLRYEAWGGVAALAIHGLVATATRRPRPPWVLVAIPAAAILAYVLLRWHADGRLLEFVRGTRDITQVQVARPEWTLREIVSFPIVMPYYVFGPAVLLVPFGLRTALPEARDWVLPAGYATFLLFSYYAGAAHAGDRYLVSLAPFVCAAIGCAGALFARRTRRPTLLLALVLAVVFGTTARQLGRARRMAVAWEPGLAEREAKLERERKRVTP